MNPARMLIVIIIIAASAVGLLLFMQTPNPVTIINETDNQQNFNKQPGGEDEPIQMSENNDDMLSGKKSVDPETGLVMDERLRSSVYFSGSGMPRDMTADPQGNLVASFTDQGKVSALPDRDNNGKADEEKVIVSRLRKPHGIAFRCQGNACQLFIAEENQVSAFDYDPATLTATNKRKLVDLPAGAGHYTRSLLFLPTPNDNQLLVSIGSSCNVCVENDNRRASVLVINADGSNQRTYASGLRNAVFMAVNPATREVWATEMGRDHLGDNLPPDEINILQEGEFYGWPYAYGKQVQDKQFSNSSRGEEMASRSIPSHIDIPAHSAPLGLAFFDSGWPDDWQGDLLVAFHGSWNRSVPTGYKIVRYDINGSQVGAAEDFITGFMKDGQVIGRPADILFHNGALYISDDKAGDIYQFTMK